jgi:hypothetical protein
MSATKPDPSPPKIFCIGANKTGTTSLKAFLRTLGVPVGSQHKGEALLGAWRERNFGPILELASSARAFQDFPFSAPFTYQALDAGFPEAKFILTVRDAESWYRSLTSFHTRIIGKERLPTAEDLRAFAYVYPGWILDVMKAVYGIDDASPYDKAALVGCFERHNAAVTEYFRYRGGSLLIINLATLGSAERIATFCGLRYEGQPMLHLKKTT